MRVRLEPQDEFMHPGEESNFNESMYFNVYDPVSRFGGFFRLGNRPNEGRGEMTVCLYLPDGRVAFMFTRPEITTNEAFDAAGLRFTVHVPFEHLEVHYEGKAIVLDDPLLLADPRRAFTESPWTEVTADLTYRRVSDMFGGEPTEPHEKPGEEFAKGHYEQLVKASGTVTVGDESFPVDGFGLRDHSWGPRFWQAPYYYRWLTANVGDDFGFMGSRVARRDSEGTRGGFVWEDGKLHVCRDFQISTGWTDGDRHHRTIAATLRSKDADGEPLEWNVTGSVLRMVPLRNRRDEMVTRISEGLTEWTLADGRVGYGWSEYLDQIIDGEPVGLAE